MKATEGGHCTHCGEWYSAGTNIEPSGWNGLPGGAYGNTYQHDMPHPCAHRTCPCGAPMYHLDLGFMRHVDNPNESAGAFCERGTGGTR